MLGPKLEIYHDSQNDFYISETLTSNFVHSMITVRASNFSDLNFTFMFYCPEESREIQENIIVNFHKNFRQASNLEMLLFFFCSVYSRTSVARTLMAR